MTEESRELAVSTFDARTTAMALFGDIARQSLDNFGGDAEQRMELEMACQSSDAGRLRDHASRIIAVKYWYAHPVTIVDDDEEISETRIVLITPSGKAYASVSTGVSKALMLILKYRGNEPLDPPMHFRINLAKGRRGDFMSLDYVPAKQVEKVDLD